jgi:hypothetical protein
MAALGAFERWSNYLLVTTVAATGWVAASSVSFAYPLLKSVTLWSLGISATFGIFTLALVPLIAEEMGDAATIYEVRARFFVLGTEWGLYLRQVCRPQHVTFILGILLYCAGTAQSSWVGIVVLVLAVVYGLLSAPRFKI